MAKHTKPLATLTRAEAIQIISNQPRGTTFSYTPEFLDILQGSNKPEPAKKPSKPKLDMRPIADMLVNIGISIFAAYGIISLALLVTWAILGFPNIIVDHK